MRYHVDILAIGVLLFGFAVFSTVRRTAQIHVQRLERIQLSNDTIRALANLPRNLSLIDCKSR